MDEMRSKRRDVELDGATCAPSSVEQTDERAKLEARVREDVELQGVIGEEGKRVARAVVDVAIANGAESYAFLLQGIRIANDARGDVAADLARSNRELQQLDRLMRGFSSELRKLDEVVEVLAAYLRRMRTTAGDATRRTLH